MALHGMILHHQHMSGQSGLEHEQSLQQFFFGSRLRNTGFMQAPMQDFYICPVHVLLQRQHCNTPPVGFASVAAAWPTIASAYQPRLLCESLPHFLPVCVLSLPATPTLQCASNLFCICRRSEGRKCGRIPAKVLLQSLSGLLQE